MVNVTEWGNAMVCIGIILMGVVIVVAVVIGAIVLWSHSPLASIWFVLAMLGVALYFVGQIMELG